MPRYVAFLRAINVGGHTVTMDDLRGLFESLGFSGVEAFIASGNVIFETSSRATTSLQGKIESCLRKALGYEVATFLRTDSEVAAIAQYKPFRDSDLKSAGAFNVGFMAEPLGRESERILMGFKTAIDDFHIHGREVYCCVKRSRVSRLFPMPHLREASGYVRLFVG